MNNRVSLTDPRLLLVASLVREGACFADVGTDHAYLPLYLLSCGRIASAIASDVAEGPLARARRNVQGTPWRDSITLMAADGLQGMEGLGLTDIAICGMGGELISSILEAAPFVRDPAVRLILQPMTRIEALRDYLAEAGFLTLSERYAVSGGRAYLCLLVSYDGIARAIDRKTAYLGDRALRDPSDACAFSAFLDTKEKEAQSRLRGRKSGGVDTSFDEALLAAIAAEREALL